MRIKIFRVSSLWYASCQNVDGLFTGPFSCIFSSVDFLYIVSVFNYVLNKNTGIFSDVEGNTIGDRWIVVGE